MARVNLFKDGKDQIGSVMGYLDSNNAECKEKLKERNLGNAEPR
jgi:hypothetical protein